VNNPRHKRIQSLPLALRLYDWIAQKFSETVEVNKGLYYSFVIMFFAVMIGIAVTVVKVLTMGVV
jgi:hypothetical protein